MKRSKKPNAPYSNRCASLRKPAAQTAHLVFPTLKPTHKKPKELFFANA